MKDTESSGNRFDVGDIILTRVDAINKPYKSQ